MVLVYRINWCFSNSFGNSKGLTKIIFNLNALDKVKAKKTEEIVAEVKDDVIVIENVQYIETNYENNKIVGKKYLKKDEYFKKVKEYKNKKLKEDQDLGLYIVDPCPIDDPDCDVPSLDDTYIYTDLNRYIDINCTSTNYTYCQATGRYSSNSYTRLYTYTHIYTDTAKGLTKSKLIWDTVPSNRHWDAISISYNSAYILGVDTSVRGSFSYSSINRQFNYSYCYDYDSYDPRYCQILESTYTSGVTTYNPNYDYDNILFNLESQNGAIMLIDLPNEPYSTYDGSHSYKPIEYTKFTITLESDFGFQNPNFFEEESGTKFGFDYAHTLQYVAFTPTLSADVSISGPSAGITLSHSLEITEDADRYSSILFKFPSW